MATVIDVGAARYGGDYSIERLIEEFKPDVVYAFDPTQGPDEYPWEPYKAGPTGPTKATVVVIEKKAAWVYDGEVGFFTDGLNSKVDLEDQNDWPKVPCFDLAKFLRTHHRLGDEIVLKIDAECSEYALLEHLIEQRADELVRLTWVEWHCLACGRGAGGHRADCTDEQAGVRRRAWIEQNIACELREWGW